MLLPILCKKTGALLLGSGTRRDTDYPRDGFHGKTLGFDFWKLVAAGGAEGDRVSRKGERPVGFSREWRKAVRVASTEECST